MTEPLKPSEDVGARCLKHAKPVRCEWLEGTTTYWCPECEQTYEMAELIRLNFERLKAEQEDKS